MDAGLPVAILTLYYSYVATSLEVYINKAHDTNYMHDQLTLTM